MKTHTVIYSNVLLSIIKRQADKKFRRVHHVTDNWESPSMRSSHFGKYQGFRIGFVRGPVSRLYRKGSSFSFSILLVTRFDVRGLSVIRKYIIQEARRLRNLRKRKPILSVRFLSASTRMRIQQMSGLLGERTILIHTGTRSVRWRRPERN